MALGCVFENIVEQNKEYPYHDGTYCPVVKTNIAITLYTLTLYLDMYMNRKIQCCIRT